MTRTEFIKDFFNGLEIDKNITDYLVDSEISEINSFESLKDVLEGANFFDCEIIYYNQAIQYLSKHDSSLEASLALADELGYQIKDLNSELLASLLESENIKNQFYECEKEISSFFESLNDFENEASLLDGKIYECENKNYYYIQYDKESMTLCAGTCGNGGFSESLNIECDIDFSVDKNLSMLCDKIDAIEQIQEDK